MKKVLLSILALFAFVNISFATVTVKEARSPEYLINGGYSQETAKMVQRRAGEYNPKPTNRWQKIGFKMWNYLDPASPQARDEARHDIKFYPHFEDL